MAKKLKIMTCEQDMIQVRREKRRYIPFEAKKSRLRNSCPKCGSLNVKKRRDTYYYICHRCGWTGEKIIKIDY